MSNVPSQIISEFDKYPSCERGDNLTRSIFDIGLHDMVTALAMQDSVTPILAAHRLRHELRLTPGWQTCSEFVTQTLADMAKDPKKYAYETTNATRNSRHYDEQRAEATGMLFHNQYSGDPLYTIHQSLSYGLLWAYERSQYDKVDLTSKVVGTFSVRNQLGAYLTGDYAGEVVQPALVLNSAINGALITYDLQPSDRYDCDGRYFWLSPGEVDTSVKVLEHTQIADTRVAPTIFRDASIKDFEQVAQVALDVEGQITIDGPCRYQDILSTY